MAIEWVLLDLGGVCLEVHQGTIYERLADRFQVPARDLLGLQQQHRAIWVDIGVREVTPAECHTLFIPTLPKEISVPHLVEAINAELGPTIDHTHSILRKLDGRVRLGCLSNTNSIHAAKLVSDYPFMNLFERRLFSQELGLSKPDLAIYERAEHLLRAPSNAILFMDDKQENVDAARQCGWLAYTYTGPKSLENALEANGL